MGNAHNGTAKPKIKRRVTVSVTTNINKQQTQCNDIQQQEFTTPKKITSKNHLKKSKKTDDINILSPNPTHINYQQQNGFKNRGKITISTHHSANIYNKNKSQTPQKMYRKSQPNLRKKMDPFLSPTAIPRCHSATIPSFSPSINKSPGSMSTASPSKYIQQKKFDNQSNENKSSGNKREIIVAERFKLVKKVGKGSFGVAYKAIDLLSNEYIAIKLEKIRDNRLSSSTNMREISILETLCNCHRVPKLIWHGQYKSFNVMALELEG
eukprot:90000_1